MESNVPENLKNRLTALLNNGLFNDALKLSEQYNKEYKNNINILYASYQAYRISNHFETALLYLQKAIDLIGANADLLLEKARLLVDMRERRAGIQLLDEITGNRELNATQLHRISDLYTQCNLNPKALMCIEKAFQLQPQNIAIRFALAKHQYFNNKLKEADHNLELVMQSDYGIGEAAYLRAKLGTVTVDNNHIEQLKILCKKNFKSAQDAAACYFALAKEYEDINQHALCFAALKTGNKIKRKNINFNLSNELSALAELENHCTAENFSRSSSGYNKCGPIFVVGMPRTGTTLVERILSSHSGVVSLGEFPDFPIALSNSVNQYLKQQNTTQQISTTVASLSLDFCTLGKSYIDSAVQLSEKSEYFVDKLPFNFLYCGHILNAMPQAKIIHLVRHPLDTCFAVYKTLFNHVYNFSYDLSELADYYIAYKKLMNHWKENFPAQILEIHYEQLVENSEQGSKALLKFCDLAWEDSVLEFYKSTSASTTASAAQVRKPVYSSSVGKWKNYACELELLVTKLKKAGIYSE